MTTKLDDVRAARAEEHAAKVRKLFEEHPDCAREAIIVWPQGKVTLAPEHMSAIVLAGILHSASISVVLSQMDGEDSNG